MNLFAPLLIATLAFSPAESPISSRWIPPIDDLVHIQRLFDLSGGEYQAGHRGIDLTAMPGQAVVAPVDGVIHFVGTVVDRGVLTIRVDDHTLISVEPVRSELTIGEAVTQGEQLAVVEGTSHCREPCLHVGVRVDGEYVNPFRLLFGDLKPRLLPLSLNSPQHPPSTG